MARQVTPKGKHIDKASYNVNELWLAIGSGNSDTQISTARLAEEENVIAAKNSYEERRIMLSSDGGEGGDRGGGELDLNSSSFE